jgi:hypothetical protein
MTTPSPATRSGSAPPPPKRAFWRPVVLWSLFFGLLLAGLGFAAVFGPSVPQLVRTVN